MAKKIMVCDECKKMFRVDYDQEKGIKCPACEGEKISSLYGREQSQ